jgi:hypothetical protein
MKMYFRAGHQADSPHPFTVRSQPHEGGLSISPSMLRAVALHRAHRARGATDATSPLPTVRGRIGHCRGYEGGDGDQQIRHPIRQKGKITRKCVVDISPLDIPYAGRAPLVVITRESFPAAGGTLCLVTYKAREVQQYGTSCSEPNAFGTSRTKFMTGNHPSTRGRHPLSASWLPKKQQGLFVVSFLESERSRVIIHPVPFHAT